MSSNITWLCTILILLFIMCDLPATDKIVAQFLLLALCILNEFREPSNPELLQANWSTVLEARWICFLYFHWEKSVRVDFNFLLGTFSALLHLWGSILNDKNALSFNVRSTYSWLQLSLQMRRSISSLQYICFKNFSWTFLYLSETVTPHSCFLIPTKAFLLVSNSEELLGHDAAFWNVYSSICTDFIRQCNLQYNWHIRNLSYFLMLESS